VSPCWDATTIMSASTQRGGYSQKPNGLGLQESVTPFVIPSSFDIRASSFYKHPNVTLALRSIERT